MGRLAIGETDRWGENVTSLMDEARRQYRAGRIDDARSICRRALAQDPDDVDAAQLLGVLVGRVGETSEAIDLLERAASGRPGDANILSNLGAVYRSAGRYDDAEARYREAIAIDAGNASAHFNLANLQAARGRAEDSLAAYQAAFELEPTNAGIGNNMATALKAAGRYEQAERVYRVLIAAHPEDAALRCNLGVLCMELGRTKDAVALYRAALDLDPGATEARNNLGVALTELGAYEEAVLCLRTAASHDDTVADIHSNLGNALRKAGATEDAEAAYRRALSLGAGDGVRLKLTTLLPVVARSAEEMAAARRRMAAGIEDLLSTELRLRDPDAEVGVTNFNLSYHDTNNRDLQAQLARLYLQACPTLAFAAPHCQSRRRESGRRLKLGFVSRHFGEHAIGWCFHGVMRHLPRDAASVTAIRFGESDDPLWRRVATEVDATMVLPPDLERARERIAAVAFDALVYTDIGMEPLTYFLAFARLAPLQCVLGGHPDTVGIPSIDLFISSAMQEPDDAESHYSEKLVRLPGAPTYYDRPTLPDPLKPRRAFGLPESATLYFCAQTLIKVHPDMDALFAEVLRRDPNGLLLLPTGYNGPIAELLRARFAGTIGDLAARIRFLPTMSHTDFMNVVALADVSLDTRPFGGGNTSWQAIAAGTPIVTWPGLFLRGRYTQALYRLIGVTDTVVDSAAEYVNTAVRLGTEAGYRAEVAARIECGSRRIFADMTHVRALHDVLVESAQTRP